jgi:hypothetical protein
VPHGRSEPTSPERAARCDHQARQLVRSAAKPRPFTLASSFPSRSHNLSQSRVLPLYNVRNSNYINWVSLFSYIRNYCQIRLDVNVNSHTASCLYERRPDPGRRFADARPVLELSPTQKAQTTAIQPSLSLSHPFNNGRSTEGELKSQKWPQMAANAPRRDTGPIRRNYNSANSRPCRRPMVDLQISTITDVLSRAIPIR